MLELEPGALVLEDAAVDGLSTCAVAVGDVATLAHELRDDPVELGALQVQLLACLAECGSVRACAEDGSGGFGWAVCAGWGGLGASGGLPETPTPFSPVQSARKFSHVLGTASPNRSKTILPAGSPPIATSMKTCDVAAGPIRTMEERRTWPGTRPDARPGT